MKCQKTGCDGKLRVANTYTSPDGTVKTQRAVCRCCGSVHVLETHSRLATKRGTGAKAQISSK